MAPLLSFLVGDISFLMLHPDILGINKMISASVAHPKVYECLDEGYVLPPPSVIFNTKMMTTANRAVTVQTS